MPITSKGYGERRESGQAIYSLPVRSPQAGSVPRQMVTVSLMVTCIPYISLHLALRDL